MKDKIELEINPDFKYKPEYINGKYYCHKLNCIIYDLESDIEIKLDSIHFLINNEKERKTVYDEFLIEKYPDGFHYFGVEGIHTLLNQYNDLDENFFIEIKIGDNIIRSVTPTNILYTTSIKRKRIF